MTDLAYKYEAVPARWAPWAGRGLTSHIVFDEVEPTCHPLGPRNKLVIAPGWVSGSPAAPSSGRTSFGAKSPLSDEGKAELSLTFQAATAFIDSTGYCLFIAFPILDIAKGWEGMAETVAGVTGRT